MNWENSDVTYGQTTDWRTGEQVFISDANVPYYGYLSAKPQEDIEAYIDSGENNYHWGLQILDTETILAEGFAPTVAKAKEAVEEAYVSYLG